MFGNSFINQIVRHMGGGQQQGFPGLLGGQQQQGLLGPMNTQNLMQQYLQQLFMRRYRTPMLQQQPGMVSSQMGPGGMQYRAPVVPQAANDPVRQQAARQEPIVFGGTWNQNIDSGW